MALHRGQTPRWQKSSRSGSGNCLEAAAMPGVVLVRDTKDAGAGLVLRIGSDQWIGFLDVVKAGEFDR
jgi:hypothetical protein